MIAVPFLYFAGLLIYIIYKKKTFDISAYVVSLYAISSFFSILIDVNGIRSFDTENYQIGIFPTILYCFLLTLVIWPFYRFKSEKIQFIKFNKASQFNYIVYFYFAAFLIILITSFANIIEILNGDLGALRNAIGNGDSISDSELGGNPIIILAGIFGEFSIIMLLFYFYSICFLKRSKLFNTIILISSMSIIVIAIAGIDRSKVIYWMISYGAMLVLFWKRMSGKQHKNVLVVSAFISTFVVIYFLAITFSRFETNDAGSNGSMISYTGQSFINFCYFFDNVKYGEFSLQRIFPLFYKLFVDNGINSTTGLNSVISLKTSKEIGVFSTFIGDIMVASGKFVAIIYCLVFYIITGTLIRCSKGVSVYFYEVLLMFCLITIPMLGLFTYFYADFTRMIPLMCFMIYAVYLRYNRSAGNLIKYQRQSL
jgi:oligosaccharide repeat unit polymerase